jgi:hypothetical protein
MRTKTGMESLPANYNKASWSSQFFTLATIAAAQLCQHRFNPSQPLAVVSHLEDANKVELYLYTFTYVKYLTICKAARTRAQFLQRYQILLPNGIIWIVGLVLSSHWTKAKGNRKCST